jgi:hypothetical protein
MTDLVGALNGALTTSPGREIDQTPSPSLTVVASSALSGRHRAGSHQHAGAALGSDRDYSAQHRQPELLRPVMTLRSSEHTALHRCS